MADAALPEELAEPAFAAVLLGPTALGTAALGFGAALVTGSSAKSGFCEATARLLSGCITYRIRNMDCSITDLRKLQASAEFNLQIGACAHTWTLKWLRFMLNMSPTLRNGHIMGEEWVCIVWSVRDDKM